MKKITPHLWFDTQAKDAVDFYMTVFPNSAITSFSRIKDTPSGDCDIVSFTLNGFAIQAISAGPYFKINPSISFMVNFDPSKQPDALEQIDTVWNKLIEGGKIMMPIQEYPFSKRYGWVEDKYGVSWQLIYTNPEGEERPFIVPSIMYTGEVAGKAKEATDFYISLFKDSKRGTISTYPKEMTSEEEDSIMFTDFALQNHWFAAMDSAQSHAFSFNEAVSFIIYCENQEEVDYFWEHLSAVPTAEQCGWLKDKYGVSWQVVPTAMGNMMASGDSAKTARVTQAFLKMKKLDIATLEAAYNG